MVKILLNYLHSHNEVHLYYNYFVSKSSGISRNNEGELFPSIYATFSETSEEMLVISENTLKNLHHNKEFFSLLCDFTHSASVTKWTAGYIYFVLLFTREFQMTTCVFPSSQKLGMFCSHVGFSINGGQISREKLRPELVTDKTLILWVDKMSL